MKESRFTEEMKVWLFDFAHRNLTDKQVLTGFIKHYVLQGLTIENIQQDIHFHTTYLCEDAKAAVDDLKRILEIIANNTEADRGES